MALFGRKKEESNDVPADLQQYYTTDNSSVMKWVVRGVAALVILALLVWGGIWLVHALTGGSSDKEANKSNKTSSQQATNNSGSKSSNSSEKSKNSDNNSKSAPKSPETSKNSTSNGGSASQPATGGSESGTNNSTQKPAQQTPAGGQGGGGQNQALVNTGPGETAAWAFLAATTAGTALHVVYQRRRQLR